MCVCACVYVHTWFFNSCQHKTMSNLINGDITKPQ